LKIVGDKTVLPSCHYACRGVQYVCPDKNNPCQLWTFACASLRSTDARRLALDGTGALTKKKLNNARRQCNRPVVKLPEDHVMCLTVPVDDCGPTVSLDGSSHVGLDEREDPEYEIGFVGFREEGNKDEFNFEELQDDKSKIGEGGRGRPVEDRPKDRSRCDEPSESPSEGPTDGPVPSSIPSSTPSIEPSTSPSSDPSAQPSFSPTEVNKDSRPTAKPTNAEPSDQPSLMPSGIPSESPAPTICVEDVQVVPLDLNSISMDFAKIVYIPIGAERVTIELLLFLPETCEEQMYIVIDDTVVDLGETHRSECTTTGTFDGLSWSRTAELRRSC
jgi:hypothetical protein